jgi:hypothetical protein
MLHVVLDWQNISETIFKKAFFYFRVFRGFYLFSVFVKKNLKNNPSERGNFCSLKIYKESKN